MSRGPGWLPFLAMCSGSEFFWTNAGRKAVGLRRAAGVRRIRPGSVVAMQLQAAADDGAGKIPKKLRAANAKAMAR